MRRIYVILMMVMGFAACGTNPSTGSTGGTVAAPSAVAAAQPATATTGLLVLPSVPPVVRPPTTPSVAAAQPATETVNATVQAFEDAMNNAVTNPPTPPPGCETISVELANGNTANIVIEEPKSLWYIAYDMKLKLIPPIIEGKLSVNGVVFNNMTMPMYILYRPSETTPTYWLPPGSYTISLKDWIERNSGISPPSAMYIIYKCPPV